MKKKSLLAVLLALVLCMSFTLSGCGGETATVVGDGNIVKVDGQYAFEVEEWGYGDKIEGSSGTSSTYSYTPIDHIAFIKLDYENLGSETMDSNNAFGGEEMAGELTIDGTSYPIDAYLPEDIVALGKGTAYICYTVPADIIKGEGEKVATFKVGDVLYQYNMVDGGSAAVEQGEDTPEGVTIEKAPEAIELKSGDFIKQDGLFECTVEGDGNGSELSDGGDGITYTYSPSDYMIWIELDLKNLDSETMDSWDCSLVKDPKLVYDGEYNYTGGLWFANDLPALESTKAFIYFEAPKEVAKGDGSKVATFEIGDVDYVYNF